MLGYQLAHLSCHLASRVDNWLNQHKQSLCLVDQINVKIVFFQRIANDLADKVERVFFAERNVIHLIFINVEVVKRLVRQDQR